MKKMTTLFVKDPTDPSRVLPEVRQENTWVFNGDAIPTLKLDGTSTAIINGDLYKRFDAKLNKKVFAKLGYFTKFLKDGQTVIKTSKKPFSNGNRTATILTVLKSQIVENSILDRLKIEKNSGRMIVIFNEAGIYPMPAENVQPLNVIFPVEYYKKIPQGAIPCQNPDPTSGHWPHWVLCDRNKKEDQYHWEAYDTLVNFTSHDELDGTYELVGPKINGNKEGLDHHILIRHGSIAVELTDFSYEGIKKYLTENVIEGIVFHHKYSDRMCKVRRKDFGLPW